MLIDAHFHSWQLSRNDYGWLTPDMGVIYRDVTVADWQKLAAPSGIKGGILVQAAPTVAETMHLLALADVNPAVLGVVGWVDFTAADAVLQIEQLAKHPKLKGLRPMLHDLPDPAWMLQPAVQPALQAMSRLGLVFDALIRPVHLPHLLKLAKQYPNLAIVIDHCAKPDIALGTALGWQPWADGMAALAELPNGSCKLSGLLTEAGEIEELTAVEPWVLYILKIFNHRRIIWGSDWPVLELTSDYETWLHSCRSLISQFSGELNKELPKEEYVRRIFELNARSIYKL